MFDLKKLRKLPKGADLSHIQPDLRDKAVPITALSGHPDNPRKHPDANKQAIAGSLRKYLQRKPVVANATEKGLRIEAGHGVYGEMLAAGAQYIAVTVVEDDAITELGYMLADNRTGDLSEDDAEKLEPILRQLIEAGEEVEEFGWDEATVKGLLRDAKDERNGDESSHDDDIPQTNHADELQKEWQTERGQVWEIPSKSLPGQCHRVVCGDCRIASDVAALLDGRKVNVAFTSPPYASQRKYDEESGFKPIKPDSYVEWFEAVQANVRAHLAQDGSWFVNIKEHCEDGQRHLYVKDLTIAHVRQWGWRFVDELCWKRQGVPGGWNNRFKNGWEPIFHFSLADISIKFRPENVHIMSESVFEYDPLTPKAKKSGFLSGTCSKRKGAGVGAARPDNVIEANTGETTFASAHGATFPLGLPTFFIKAYSDPSDSIFDPFLGSGTTMIAAEREGRIAYGTEISPKYVAVILQRAKDAGLQPRRLNV
jgi:site-specific DNA-methyltransferase (adenine-specific)/site-specific DNA-methyltransferase (cytosine-N4-specific)